ncbi:hypothetical protein [Clostridium gasigenes]|uniref:HNH endonuclease n=1 Tax=Clostridium gasigenes TaxID=94869 RepID=A0A1H0S352_9CLOT|nr:hypothetical protein [Clostridium gasigenes]SDP35678.1 hypothetical protein SAMN04488529_104121 [Clostridium gasigenes]
MNWMLFAEDEYYEELIKEFKLTFSALPVYMHGNNLRSVSPYIWNKLRKEVLLNNECNCITCGAVPKDDADKKNFHLHEQWDIDKTNYVLNLTGLEMICRKCHDVEHIGRIQLLIKKGQLSEDYLYNLIDHVAKVNECETNEVVYSLKKFNFEFLMSGNSKKDELANKKWTYTIYKELPLYDNVITILIKKDLLYKNK